MRLVVKRSSGVAVIQGWTGSGGSSPMELTHTPGKGWLAAGGSSRFFSMWSFPQDYLSVLMTWHLAFLRLNDPRKGLVQTVTSLWLGLEFHTLSFSKYLSEYTDSPHLMQEETAQEYKHTRGLEPPKVTLEPGHHTTHALSISVGQFIPRSQEHCALWPPSHYTELPLSQSSSTLLTLHSLHSMPFSLRNPA